MNTLVSRNSSNNPSLIATECQFGYILIYLNYILSSSTIKGSEAVTEA